MKIIYYLRMIFRSVFTQFPMLFLMYVIFPFALSFFMSSSMAGVLEPTIEDPNIEVYVSDEDGTEQSNTLQEMIRSKELNRIFDVKTDEDDAEFIIRIPSGFGAQIKQNPVKPVEIEGKNAASRNTGRLLQFVLSDLTSELGEAMVLAEQVQTSSLNEQEKIALQEEVAALQEKNSISAETYSSETMLSSKEYFSVVIISYLMVLFLSSSVSAEGMTESIGFAKRWRAAPITKWEAWGMEVLGNTLYFFLFIFLYIVMWRVVGSIFQQNPMYLLLIIFLHALIVGLANSFITYTFSNAVGKIIVNAFLFFVLIFGGMLGPLEKMTGMAIFERLNSETVTYFITKPYWTVMTHNSWQELAPIILQLIFIVGGLTILNVLSIRFRKKGFA